MTKRTKPSSARPGLTKTKFNPKAQNAGKTTNTSPRSHSDHVSCVAEILRTAAQPLSLRQIVEQVRDVYSHPKDATDLVRAALEKLFQAIPVTSERYGWFATLLAGSTIRHPLTADEAGRGYLLMDELEHAAFFPQFFQFHRADDRIVQVELFGGPTIPAEAYIERKTWSLYLGPQFAQWIEQQGGEESDDLLIIVNDAEAGRYTLRLHPREIRDNSKIHSHNMNTALLAEKIVRQWRTTRDPFPTWKLAAALVGHGIYATDTPPDDLHCVLHQYSLLHYNGTGYVLKGDDNAARSPEQRAHSTRSFSVGKLSRSIFDTPDADAKSDDEATEQMDTPSYFDTFDDEFEDAYEAPDPLDPRGPALSHPDLRDKYNTYLARSRHENGVDMPLSFEEFSLLDSELQSLANLEKQFGYLLVEQQRRQHEISVCLLLDDGADHDGRDNPSDYPKFDDPSHWGN